MHASLHRILSPLLIASFMAAVCVLLFGTVVRAGDCSLVPCDPSTGECGSADCANRVPINDSRVVAPDTEPPGSCAGGDGTGWWIGVGGPSGGTVTTYPVNYAYGHKQMSATDLRVELPGRDFALSRSYMSTSGLHEGSFAKNWQLNVGTYLHRVYDTGTSDNVLRVSSYATGASTFTKSGSVWKPNGPHSQYIETDTLSIDIGGGTQTYNVYVLVEPGQWKAYYGRYDSGSGLIGQNSWKDGAVFRVADWHGHTKSYKYADIAGTSTTMRLETITCTPSGGGSNDGAKVIFAWHSTDHATTELRGALEKVTVQRYTLESSTWAWRDVQKAEYLYKTGSNDHLGSTRDLIQVSKSVRVDHGQWYDTIEQYRYHNTINEGSDSDSDGFLEKGSPNQLKAYIAPEQIEYAAEQFNAAQENDSTRLTLAGYATHLRGLADGGSAYGSIKLMALAANVVARYKTTGSLEVEEQYLQSACGCGGGAAQGIKLAYTFATHTSGDYARSLKVVETTHDGTSGTNPYTVARRTRYYDLKKFSKTLNSTSVDVYLLGLDVIQESSTKEWVTQYVYDSTRHVEEIRTPSVHTDYTPGTDAGASATVTSSTGAGLVQRFTYSGDSLILTKSVKKGTNGTAVKTDEWTYDGTHTHLLAEVKAFRTENGSPTPGEIESTAYAYTFRNGSVIEWVETSREAELESENGPTGSSVKYHSHEYFDANGFNTWSRAEDGSLTKRTFGDGGAGSANDNGKPTAVEENAAPASPITSESVPCSCSLAGRNSDGSSLITEYTYDPLGRLRAVESPSGVITRYAYELSRSERRPHERAGFKAGEEPYLVTLVLPHTFSSSFDGAAQVSIHNAAGRVFESTSHTMSSDSGSKYGDITFGFSDPYDFILSTTPLSRSTVQHHLSGLVENQKVWHSIAGIGEGSGIYTTSYTYDVVGRPSKVTAPNGTVTKYTYDKLDRMITMLVGTDDTNPVTVSETYYDSPQTATQGVGNGTMTLVRNRLDDTSGYRDTKYTYDFRDRLLLIEAPAKPNTLMIYDNLDRVVEQAVFKDLPVVSDDLTGSDADRGQYTKTFYSQRGMVYKQAVAIDPTLVTASRTYLETHSWFDETGRTVGQWSPNAAGTKTTYDGLGRAKVIYTTDRRSDDVPGASGNYADVFASHAAVVSDDVIIEEVEYNYISAEGLLDRVTDRQRSHRGINLTGALVSDSDTGPLSASGMDHKSIRTYTGTMYDDADRVRYSIDYGTNSASGFISNTGAPSVSQTTVPTPNELVTETKYDNRGRVEQTIDPEGMKTKFEYDDMNRRIAVIENYDNAVIGWNTTPTLDRWGVTSGLSTSNLDQDRVTSYVYDGAGNVVQQVAHLPASGSPGESVQVTRYIYGVIKGTNPGDSGLYSNDLLFKTHYPDESTGEHSTSADYTVAYAYNRQGELVYMKDQNLTVHDYTRDNLGRVTADKATRDTGNSTLDNTIKAMGTAYDLFGRVEFARSYSDLAMTTVTNAVKFTYTPLWQTEKVWQEHTGNVDDDGTPPDSYKTTYAYSTAAVGSGNHSRLTSLTYPGTESLPYTYGASGSSDDKISRLTKLDLSGHPVGYDYIGMGMVAIVDAETPNIQLDRYRSHFGVQTASPMTYPGFDRFGRVARHLWVDNGFTSVGSPVTGSNVPPIVDLAYTYDKASNRLTAYNENIAQSGWENRDWKYTYDGLDRLKQADRGKAPTGGGGFTHVANPSSSEYLPGQGWTLDALGNWKSFLFDKDSDGADGVSPDNTEARNHNQANELSAQDPNNDTTFGLDHTFDVAGNMRTQKVGSESTPTTVTYTHDLWNRLVKVEATPSGGRAATRAEYAYNSLNWRIMKRSDTNPTVNVALDQERKMYYSAEWQLLEERVDDDYVNSAGVNRRFQYIWGPRYIDDLVLRRLDANADGDFSDSGSDQTYYHCTDAMFSTVAVLNDAAVMQERVSYDPYGRARHHKPADCAGGEGGVNVDDQLTVTNTWGSVPAAGDINRSGTVNVDDLNAVTNGWGAGLSSGHLSTTDNQIGWDGYVFNPELADFDGGLYTVRHRHYHVGLGRWVERDPLDDCMVMSVQASMATYDILINGLNWAISDWNPRQKYKDGMNVYEYTRSGATNYSDPLGLCRWKDVTYSATTKFCTVGGQPGIIHCTRKFKCVMDLKLLKTYWIQDGKDQCSGKCVPLGTPGPALPTPIITPPNKSLSPCEQYLMRKTMADCQACCDEMFGNGLSPTGVPGPGKVPFGDIIGDPRQWCYCNCL